MLMWQFNYRVTNRGNAIDNVVPTHEKSFKFEDSCLIKMQTSYACGLKRVGRSMSIHGAYNVRMEQNCRKLGDKHSWLGAKK